MVQRYRPAAMLDIVEFTDEHLDAAAALLAARHGRHRKAEPLLPAGVDFRAEIEKEFRAEGAQGVFASQNGRPISYLIARPLPPGWMVAGIAGHAIEGDPERIRDVYAAAAHAWHEAGHTRHAVFVPAPDRDLVERWFRLSFGASAALATRETAPELFQSDVSIRLGTPDDLDAAVQLDLAMNDSMRPAPSFSGLTPQPLEEIAAEWREDTWVDGPFTHFVAELDRRVVGHSLLYKRPPDLRVPADSIDLAQASTLADMRGGGVARALFAHVLGWAHEQGYPTMVTDWRMTNLLASRFWPKRGFRETFLRLYRSIP